MAVDEIFEAPWTRKHDDPRTPLIAEAPRIAFPNSLEELIELCKKRKSGERMKAAGSHWALSHAALGDHTFIETNDPGETRKAMGKTLQNVVPGCLHPDLLIRMGNDLSPSETLVHVEAGKRIYQLYAELDQVDRLDGPTFAGLMKNWYDNEGYKGPWALPTLGGAGGQTIVGALTTGTHGGDFDRPPIADAVVAIHLVADGGRHYWIELEDDERYYPQLTEDDALKNEYGQDKYGGRDNFEIVRDNDVFDAVLVSAGRFGVIYSVVLAPVPQHQLYERRRLHTWQEVKPFVADRGSDLYTEPAVPTAYPADPPFEPSWPIMGDCRFLQIVVCLTPHANFQKNLAGVTKRWPQLLSQTPPGRAERVGKILNPLDPRIQAPLFENAGKRHAFSDDPDPSFLEGACSNRSFVRGIIEQTIKEIEEFIESDGEAAGSVIAAAAVVGGIGLALLIPGLLIVLAILSAILAELDDDDRLGEHMETLKNSLLDPNEPDPVKRAAGILAWQMIAFQIFEAQQGPLDLQGIGYAIMDRKNYSDRSCEINVDSIEVFFDAVDSRLIAFVDGLIAFEIAQEMEGKACVGYASLRFMGPSRATIGMQKHDVTCAVEVAALKDVSGGQQMVEFASTLARNPAIDGLVHWGQRNDYTMADVERRYGDSIGNPGGDLGSWRAALSLLTRHGQLDGFSSEFTRRTGLEVVTPKIEDVTASPSNVHVGDTVTVNWDASENPPGTVVTLHVVTIEGWIYRVTDLPFQGSHTYQIASATYHTFGIEVTHLLNGTSRRASKYVNVAVT